MVKHNIKNLRVEGLMVLGAGQNVGGTIGPLRRERGDARW